MATASKTSKLLMAAGRGLGRDLYGEAKESVEGTVQERDLVSPLTHPSSLRRPGLAHLSDVGS